MTETVLRPHAEQAFAHELDALARVDDKPRPANWRLSPWAVVQYLMGATLPDGTQITPKYVGNQRLIEVAVATLATDRALLLLGVPGTAKSWVSEHLAAAVSGDSTHRGYRRGGCALRLELCPPARGGSFGGGAGALTDHDRDGAWRHCPSRRTYPDAI